MNYSSLLQKINTRVMSAEALAFYTDKDITPPSNVICWEDNPERGFDEADNPQPPRPYIGVQLADLPLEVSAGRASGGMQFTVKVVQDSFHLGRQDSPDLSDYLKVLEYAEYIHRLLHGYQGLQCRGYQKPIFSGNLVIINVRVYVHFDYLQGRLPV